MTGYFNATTTAGGTFSIVPSVGSVGTTLGVFGDIAYITAGGSFDITYTVGNAVAGGTCFDSETISVTLSFNPQPSIDMPDELCTDGVSGLLSDYYTGITPTFSSTYTSNWQSSNPAVLTITDASTGAYTIMGIGTTTISLTETITDGGVGSCQTTVFEVLTVVDGGNATWTAHRLLCVLALALPTF
ncbi:MAG: hypothetical protein IPL33_00380 [Sphingobacteriales bacterium]|nr:hypothetical protein [Sphingobacteriales bacterium]